MDPMPLKNGRWLRVLAATLLAAACGSAVAQAWPNRPVRMVIPWPPGGGADIVGRILAEPLGQALGQTVVVENRGGSNGVIGAEAVARAVPDGYTVMFHSVTSHMLNPSFFPKLPYDTFADFAMVGLVSEVPLVIVVNPSLPVKTLPDLIALARRSGSQLSFASFGAGSISQLAGELFNRQFGLKMVHVPYKGGGPALSDVLGGHVPIYFSGIGTSLAQMRAGKLRPLGVTTAARSKLLPRGAHGRRGHRQQRLRGGGHVRTVRTGKDAAGDRVPPQRRGGEAAEQSRVPGPAAEPGRFGTRHRDLAAGHGRLHEGQHAPLGRPGQGHRSSN